MPLSISSLSQMQTTRRKLFGSLLAVIAAPFAPNLKAEEEQPEIIIRAGDPGADNLEVYNQDTGEIQKFVFAISLGRWIDVLTYVDPKPEPYNVTWKVTERRENGCTVQPIYPDFELPTIRVPGNWQVRQKSTTSQPFLDRSKDIFGYKLKTTAPFPYPVTYQELPKS